MFNNHVYNRKVVTGTRRSGKFEFQAGINFEKMGPEIARIEEVKNIISSMAISPDREAALETEIITSSISGTLAVEGGNVSVGEIKSILETSEKGRGERELVVINTFNAYARVVDYAKCAYSANGQQIVLKLNEEMFLGLHHDLTVGLKHDNSVPGQYRDNPESSITEIVDIENSCTYSPPKCLDDVKILMGTYIEWINNDDMRSLPPLIRASLAHLYFEIIHPFWGCNGRIGRIVEAMILLSGGYKHTPFMLANYYCEHINGYYSVLNTARKLMEVNDPYPNIQFVEFFLKGKLDVLEKHCIMLRKLV